MLHLAKTIVDELTSEVGARSKEFPSPEHGPLPERRVLTEVVTELLWASTLSEEGRACRPRLLYDRGAPLHAFATPIALDRQTLRKLSPAHGPRGYLTWASNEGRPCLTGIWPKYERHNAGLILSVTRPCALDVLWIGARVLSLKGGEYRALSSCGLPQLHRALADLCDVFGASSPLEDLLPPTVQAILDEAHGGSIWIVTPNATPKVDHMVTTHAGIVEMDNDNEVSRQSIGNLASIDGAVVIDASLNVLGIGAFVESGKLTVMQRKPDGSSEPIDSEKLGGGRHRSAVSFCASNAPAAALVVSADGRITLCWCKGSDQLAECAEVVALGVPVRSRR